MAITYLKSSKSATDRAQDDAQTKAVVETTLAEIEARGDEAVRALAKTHDNYTPASFRLSEEDIKRIMAKVSHVSWRTLSLPKSRYETLPKSSVIQC